MKFERREPPREFEAGFEHKVVIKDCGTMRLDADEQVTFVTESGGEYDVTRKAWGFYATPSMNGRLARFDLRPVLVKNRLDRFFLLLVEAGKEGLFQEYVDREPLEIVCWMDSLENLKTLEEKVRL